MGDSGQDCERCTKMSDEFCKVCAHFFRDGCYNNHRKNPQYINSFCYTP